MARMNAYFELAAALLLPTVISGRRLEPIDFFGGSATEDYLDWYNSHGAEYTGSTFLPVLDNDQHGAAIHWSLSETHIQLAVAIRAPADSEGWMGFGLSENGGMSGSDIFLFQTNDPTRVIDAHVLEELVPIEDDCQDWELVRAQNGVDGTEFVVVEVRRLLDTQDSQDHPIVSDKDNLIPVTRFIAAWGDTPTPSYHGGNKVRGAIQWSSNGVDQVEAFSTTMRQEADGSFEIRAENYSVRPRDTVYADFCVTWADLVAQGVTEDGASIVGFEPIIDNAQFVHHFTVYGSSDPMENGCADFPNQELAYVWGPGEPPLALPSDVGAPVGPGAFQSFQLEIHYDNKNLIQGETDSSGVRFHFSSTKRPVEAGILQLGDPFVSKYGQAIGSGITEHSFTCPGSCSRLLLSETVTVVREYLHMHSFGASASNELIRNGQVVHVGAIEFFDFNQQGNQAVLQQPYEVQAGDSFRTVCNYNPRGKDNVVFGLSSQEEMCIAFLMYYPRQLWNNRIPWLCGSGFSTGSGVCEASAETRSLDALSRNFGTKVEECTAPAYNLSEQPSSSPVQSLGPTATTRSPVTLSPVAVLSDEPSASPVASPSNLPTSTAPITQLPVADTPSTSEDPSPSPVMNPSSSPTSKVTAFPTQAPEPGLSEAPSLSPVEKPISDERTEPPVASDTSSPVPKPTNEDLSKSPSSFGTPTSLPTLTDPITSSVGLSSSNLGSMVASSLLVLLAFLL